MQSIEQAGRTIEDAVKNALKILGVSRDDVDVEVLSQESRGLLGILGYSEAKVRVTVKSAPVPPVAPSPAPPAAPPAAPRPAITEVPPLLGEPSPLAVRARDLLDQVLSLMGVTAQAEIIGEDPESIYLVIRDEAGLGLLIGRRGQTLAALQILVAIIANRPLPPEERKRIILDAADYRARRERDLVAIAQSAAARAKRTGREVPLQALNPRERRIVHVTLADDPDVTTRSEGDEPERFVVIVPTRPREPSRDRGRGGRRF